MVVVVVVGLFGGEGGGSESCQNAQRGRYVEVA